MKCPVEVLPGLTLKRSRINSGDSWYSIWAGDIDVTNHRVSRLPAYRVASWIKTNLAHIDWTLPFEKLQHDPVAWQAASAWRTKFPAA